MTSTSSVRYARFWKRCCAFILDLLIANIVVGFALQLIFGDALQEWAQLFIERLQAGEPPPELFSPYYLPVSIFLPAAYFTVFWVKWKALPAQMLFKIQVVNVRTGGNLNPAQAIGRFFMLGFICLAILQLELVAPMGAGVLILLIYFSSRFHPQRRTFHDFVSNSAVIEVQPTTDFERQF